MTRFDDKQKAIALRLQGMSYSQIKSSLKVGKSTLSYWLSPYPLSRERIKELRDKNEGRIEKFRVTMKTKRDHRLKTIYESEKKNILPLNNRDLFIAGLFLYWGEGTKSHTADLSVSNTDPSIINFSILWLTKCLGVSKNNLRVYLHLYNDMDIEKEIEFWSKVISIPIKQFCKPYIKQSNSIKINHKRGFGHGTCNIKIGNARLTEKVLMSIQVITDMFIKTRP
ncbi:MAG TPA: hypothetical protein VJH75_02620 [Patescibacteria group bacterium]|nr:hypothetical protein [Patescibacteria group bacterium]